MELDPNPGSRKYTGSLVRRAQQRHVALWLREVSTEISSVQYAALAALAQAPGLSQRELGDELDLDRSTIADLVARMVRHGLVERAQHADDKRRKTLKLAPEGQAQFEALTPHVATVEQHLTAALTAEEAQELRRLLAALL